MHVALMESDRTQSKGWVSTWCPGSPQPTALIYPVALQRTHSRHIGILTVGARPQSVGSFPLQNWPQMYGRDFSPHLLFGAFPAVPTPSIRASMLGGDHYVHHAPIRKLHEPMHQDTPRYRMHRKQNSETAFLRSYCHVPIHH